MCPPSPPQVLEDTFEALASVPSADLRAKRLSVTIKGEEADAPTEEESGRLKREKQWLALFTKAAFFDRGVGLFTSTSSSNSSGGGGGGGALFFQPSKASSVAASSSLGASHLAYFKLVGRVVGKALLEGQQLDVRFTRALLKRILGKAITFRVRNPPPAAASPFPVCIFISE